MIVQITQLLPTIADSLTPAATVGITLAAPGSISGPVGATGPAGPIGPVGPAGPTGVASYTFVQAVATDVWNIAHNLNAFPSVQVVDSSGQMVEGDLQYISANQVVVSFVGGFAGTAYLN